MKQTNQKCENRIDNELKERLCDLRKLWAAETAAVEDGDPDIGRLSDYGLCFDFVAPETFDDQTEAYFRYQISWGGPSDEFRFFVGPDLSCHRVEYWFLDWFDGAHRALSGDASKLLLDLWRWFKDSGAAQTALRSARS